jgi:hypothetical protein
MDNAQTLQLVVSRLAGGLGNQLFQYAAGHALARRLGVPLQLDRSALEVRSGFPNETPRSYALDAFELEVASADRSTIDALSPQRHGLISSVLTRIGFGTRPHVLAEQGKDFDPRSLKVKAPVLLIGHWQNERYFASVAQELRDRLLVPRHAPSERNRALAAQCKETITASIHVRRGDYVHNSKATAYHGVLPTEYFQAAANELIQDHGVQHFMLFSDDPEWVKDNLQLPCPSTMVDHNTGDESHWDLWLMKQCAHNIIANSSFSWWGAWLGDPQGRTVIAPRNWFADSSIRHGIIPATWSVR